MTDLISIVHALACIFVVIFILLQDPKGGVLGVLGGGSQSLFKVGGAKNFLVEATKYLSILFAITSLSLSYISSKDKDSLLLKEGGVVPISTKQLPQESKSQKKDANSKKPSQK